MKKLLNNDGLIGKLKSNNEIEIKVSFEDEGADFIDILQLKFLCIEANIPITLKIAGPEAIRDIKDANKLNIVKLVAPMIESDFALTKYVTAVKRYMNVDDKYLGINIETINAVKYFNEMRRNENYKKLIRKTPKVLKSQNRDELNEGIYGGCASIYGNSVTRP